MLTIKGHRPPIQPPGNRRNRGHVQIRNCGDDLEVVDVGPGHHYENQYNIKSTSWIWERRRRFLNFEHIRFTQDSTKTKNRQISWSYNIRRESGNNINLMQLCQGARPRLADLEAGLFSALVREFRHNMAKLVEFVRALFDS
ncbi:hypothetical protein N7495_008779 [Penicillium taxi]|uniref:uncharacterized protein n=1 Tax=Penicillium taxi TaxID=168475 RepID=UPI002545A034|nr:uncharacterized protein N7495_008779 [Penicillium taxi]KAJ5888738.1 hypothetical protein N7495_008779 [Penicillium taxi]